MFSADYLIAAYPEKVVKRYNLKHIPETGGQLLEDIGRKRGCLRAGGFVDLQRAAEILIHEIRNGALGQLSFETPEMIAEETIVAES